MYWVGLSGTESGEGMDWDEGRSELIRLRARKMRNRLSGLSRWVERAKTDAGVGRRDRTESITPMLSGVRAVSVLSWV